MESRNTKRLHRHNRIKAKITGTAEKPRLSVFRSLNHIYVQLVDDIKGQTIVSASDKEVEAKKQNPSEVASEVGKIIAQKAIDKKIKTVVFDRGGYKYHGRVSALAEGARSAGLQF